MRGDWESGAQEGQGYPSMGGGYDQGIGAAGAGIGALFGQMFGPNPYEGYQKQMGQIPGMLDKYYGPYLQAGQQALGGLQGQFGKMMGDPGGLLAKFGSGYQESPGYKFRVNEAIGGANRASAAGGMFGTPAEKAAISDRVGGLASQDYQQYLSNVLGMYGKGIAGEQGIENQGYGAARGMAGDLGQYYGQQARDSANEAREKQRQGAGLGGMFGGLASLAGYL